MPAEIIQASEPPKVEPQLNRRNPNRSPTRRWRCRRLRPSLPRPVSGKIRGAGRSPVVFAPAKFAQAPPPAPPKPATRTVVKMTGAEGGTYPAPRYLPLRWNSGNKAS